MAATVAPGLPLVGAAERARFHFVMRFSVATSAAFVICEWMDWQPAALAAVLTGVLLANLPFSPPPKVGIGLVIIMAICAWMAFIFTTLLRETPHILFGLIAVFLFLALSMLAQAKAQLPMTLLIVCFTVLPVMALTAPQVGEQLTSVFVRGMALAVIFTWVAFAIWPLPSPTPPGPPPATTESPVAAAAIGTAIILPLMLVYLMFGLTDAIPVLLTTALLVAKIEEERSAATASAKLIGNFLGGFIAVPAYYAVEMWPNLTTLAIVTLVIGIGFGLQIVKGGVRGGNALLAYNATMVIFGLAILKGPANSGTWGARVVQFGIACTFAVGMMILLLPLARGRRAPR